jgi:hypothetical protein
MRNLFRSCDTRAFSRERPDHHQCFVGRDCQCL